MLQVTRGLLSEFLSLLLNSEEYHSENLCTYFQIHKINSVMVIVSFRFLKKNRSHEILFDFLPTTTASNLKIRLAI